MILVRLAGPTARRTKRRPISKRWIQHLFSGEYRKPVRVVAFNTAEGWARDVSEDVVWEVVRRSAKEGRELPEATHEFAVFYVGERELQRELA